MNLSYFEYLRDMRKMLGTVLTNKYFEIWGRKPSFEKIWALNKFYGETGIAARLLFWFLLLGPSLFLFFFIPSFLFNFLFGAHFNYVTHRPNKENNDKIDIVNVNSNFFYKLSNFLFFDIYFHKNHHVCPRLFSPRKVNLKKRT